MFTSVNAVDVVFDSLGTAMDTGAVESMELWRVEVTAAPRVADWTEDRRGSNKRVASLPILSRRSM